MIRVKERDTFFQKVVVVLKHHGHKLASVVFTEVEVRIVFRPLGRQHDGHMGFVERFQLGIIVLHLIESAFAHVDGITDHIHKLHKFRVFHESVVGLIYDDDDFFL